MKRQIILMYGLFCTAIVTFIISSCAPKEKEMPITTSSEEAKQLFIQARDYLENIEFPKASQLFEEAIQKDSAFALAYFYKSYTGGGTEVINKNIERAMSLSGNISEGEQLLVKFRKAVTIDKDQKLADEYLAKLLQMFPEDKHLNFYKGWVLSNRRENDSAVVYLKKAIEIDANYAPAHNILGYDYLRLGNNQLAENEFKEYIRLAPEHPNPYDSYGEFLLKTGRYDESIENYLKSNNIDPSFTTAFLAAGDNYIFKGDYAKARDYYQMYFDKANTIQQKMSAEYSKALSFIYESKIGDAVAILKKGVDSAASNNLTPYVIGSYSSLQYIFSELGDPKEGVAYAKKAIEELQKSNLGENEKESQLNELTAFLGYAHVFNNDTKKALLELEKYKTAAMKKQDDKMYDYYHGLGLINLKEKKYEQAIENFKRGALDEPNNLYWLAQAYLKSGNKEEANKIFDQLKNWNQNDLSYAIVRNKMTRTKI